MRLIRYTASLLSIFFSTVLAAQQLRTVQQIEGIPPKIEDRALTHDPAGNLYVATSADVFMIPAGSYQAQPMQVGDQIVDVDWSAEYGLIMLHREGVIRFVSTGKELRLEAGGAATCMDLTRQMIWVGTQNGVFTVSIPQERVVDHFTTDDGTLVSNTIHFIHMDPYGIRWIGTQAGVARVDGKKWKLYEDKQAFTAITSTEEGAWLAADNEMWLVNKFNRWFPIDAWRDLVSGRVKALSSDASGVLYIASEWLVKYDPYQEKVLSMNEGGVAEETILLDRGPGRNIWMAGHNGLARVVEDTTRVLPPAPPGAPLTALVNVLSTPVCPGQATGRLRVEVQGGEAPYAFSWSGGGQSGQEVSNLAAGLYQVTITDQSGKTMVASGIVPAAPAMQVAVRATGKASDKLATDGAASVDIRGGTEPFQVAWDSGEQARTASGLTAGNHTVRIVDANGCEATGEVAIEADKVLKSLDINTLSLGQTIRVDKLYFTADSATIEQSSYAVLAEMQEFLSQHPNVVVEIGGHTNSLPTDEYCDRLSTARARNVAEFLYQQGIPESQISYVGYGKRQPIATNQTVDGRRRNQRVEIKIISM